MLDLAEQIARTVDEAVAPVSADEARARAGARTHFRRTAVLASAVAVLLLGAALVAALAAIGVGRHSTAVPVGTNSSTTRPTAASVPLASIPTGAPVGKLDIDAINVHWIVVQGESVAAEAKGPMHDPETPLPGQPGNVVIAGHRTTHGAPFFRLDELKPGDVIRLTTNDGAFTYIVDGRFVVPAQGDAIFPGNVLDRLGGRTRSLTLITNTPRYSAAERLVVTATGT